MVSVVSVVSVVLCCFVYSLNLLFGTFQSIFLIAERFERLSASAPSALQRGTDQLGTKLMATIWRDPGSAGSVGLKCIWTKFQIPVALVPWARELQVHPWA